MTVRNSRTKQLLDSFFKIRDGNGTGLWARELEPSRLRRRILTTDAGIRLRDGEAMVKFLLFCILLVLCWPLALLGLVLYPFVWLLLLPFRVVGIAVGGVLELVKSIILLPARVLRAV
jgi:hypothetical protein